MNEPKAWLYICDGDEKHPVITHTKQSWPNHEGGWWKEVPLYAQREWVGLTDEDFYGQSELQVMAMKYAEAKLKEKQ